MAEFVAELMAEPEMPTPPGRGRVRIVLAAGPARESNGLLLLASTRWFKADGATKLAAPSDHRRCSPTSPLAVRSRGGRIAGEADGRILVDEVDGFDDIGASGAETGRIGWVDDGAPSGSDDDSPSPVERPTDTGGRSTKPRGRDLPLAACLPPAAAGGAEGGITVGRADGAVPSGSTRIRPTRLSELAERHWASPYWPSLASCELNLRPSDQLASMADALGGLRGA